MDWQNDEFENLLRKFQLRESRPLPLIPPVSIRRYQVRIAAAAALALVIGASAAIVRQLALKKDAPAPVAQTIEKIKAIKSIEPPVAVATSSTSGSIPAVPQPKTPPVKPDPKAPEPLKQLTVVVPAEPQDAGPLSRQDSPARGGVEAAEQAFRKALEDQGRQIFNNACGLCHSPDLVGNSHFGTPEEYAAMVNRMAGMGAPVSPQQVSTVADYLFKTYGMKQDSGIADRGKAIANAACTKCHSLDALDNQKGAEKDAYRSIVNNMISYGATVSADAIDPLVEYLFKTYGRPLKK